MVSRCCPRRCPWTLASAFFVFLNLACSAPDEPLLIHFFFLAFILYRQHYQAVVVAHNPGLANPEISKIIGEQWRSLSEEEKSKWKALAEVSYLLDISLHEAHSGPGRKSPPSAAISRLPVPAPAVWPGWELSKFHLGHQSQPIGCDDVQPMRRPCHECTVFSKDTLYSNRRRCIPSIELLKAFNTPQRTHHAQLSRPREISSSKANQSRPCRSAGNTPTSMGAERGSITG